MAQAGERAYATENAAEAGELARSATLFRMTHRPGLLSLRRLWRDLTRGRTARTFLAVADPQHTRHASDISITTNAPSIKNATLQASSPLAGTYIMRVLALALPLLLLALQAPLALAQASFGGQNLYPWNNIYNQRIDHRTGYDDIGLWWNSAALIDLLDGDGTRPLGFSVFSVDTVGSCGSCVSGFMPVTRDYSNAAWTWVAFDTVLAGETDTCSTTKSWSDQAIYPWDSSTPFEQGTGNTDRHMITLYTTGSKVYEVYRALYPGGTYARGCN